MDVFEAINSRYSCRAFIKDRPPTEAEIEQLLDAARQAPSACNGQPWRFVVVLDAETRAKLAPLTHGIGINRFVGDAPCLIAVWEAPSNLSARFGETRKHQDYSGMDIGLAVSNLCLAATALGLQTCILGWFDEPAAKELLNIDPAMRLRLIVALGHGEPRPARPHVRKPLSELIRYIK